MELPSQEKVVKKGGRPKLKPGEKGQYNVSRKQQAKLRVQKKETKARRKKSEATVKKIKQTIAKPSGSKVIEQETLAAAPKAVRDLVEDKSEIIFKPNDGPQTDFLASPERDVWGQYNPLMKMCNGRCLKCSFGVDSAHEMDAVSIYQFWIIGG